MASVFTPCAGGVHKVQICGDDGVFKITFDGATLAVPVTGFAVELQGNYQFLHTVNDFVYLYVFGDRIGELVVTGMGFYGNGCGNEGNICELLTYYMANRVAKKQNPITIGLGDCKNFMSFLTGMRIEASRPETNVAQWVLRFNVLVQE